MVSLNTSVLLVALASVGNVEILEFTSASCGPCRMMQPTIQRLIAEGAPIRQVDINRDQQLAAQYRVTGVPCFVMLHNGQEVDRVVGSTSYARLRQMLAQATGGASAAGVPAATAPQQLAPPQQAPRQQAPRQQAPRQQAPRQQAPRQQAPRQQAPRQVAPQVPIARTSPIAPGRSSAAASSRELLVGRILAATVRLKVSDPQGHSYGSGTIIDTHGTEALVLTCAHIFRDSQARGEIEVDLFLPSGHVAKPGQLVSYDMESDVALVSMQPGMTVEPMRVAAESYRLLVGQRLVSAGCDRGGEPSQRETRVTSLDKYLGPANVEVAGQPVDGRSGGGLFTLDGTVVGVCFGAEPTDNEGLYAAAKCAHQALDSAGLSFVYQSPEQRPGVANQATVQLAGGSRINRDGNGQGAARIGDTSPLRAVPAATSAVSNATETGTAEQRLLEAMAGGGGDTEIICVIRPRNRPGAKSDLIVLDRASPAFVEQLSRELRNQSTRQLASPPGARDVDLATERLSTGGAPLLLSPAGSTIRGQSPLR